MSAAVFRAGDAVILRTSYGAFPLSKPISE